jgi:hypothetical protein
VSVAVPPRTSQWLEALRALERWLDRHAWQAWEPHDGLNTPLYPLIRNNRLALLVLKQVVMRSPVNLRPLLGIPRGTSPESMGFFARGYVRLARAFGDPEDRAKAARCLAWLGERSEKGYSGLCWGNQFAYVTKFLQLPKGMPIVVWTAHNAHAFLDAFEAFGTPSHLDAAVSAATFVLRDLPRHTEGDALCISYAPSGNFPVHNANLLGASLLARVSRHTGDLEMREVARRAVRYTVDHQLPDGAWWYAEAPTLRWVDNFHTGYNLDCLHEYRAATGDGVVDDPIARGLRYYVEHFFLSDGTPKYFHDRTYPVDIQSAAQSIETLLLFRAELPAAAMSAERVANWTLAHLRDPSGYFHHRITRRTRSRTPLLHWGQATMFSALAGLAASEARA